MEHLKYCVSEILTAKELLSIPNSSFFSRSIARMIAIRNDDFIKSSFRVNRANGRNQRITDDTNALKSFYNDYFATQRNKFGAHFQVLDFTARFDCWQNIDYETCDFFIDMPIAIYDLFFSDPNFITASSLVATLPANFRQAIQIFNDDSDIEKHPTIGVDALALMRPNTSGILPGNATQLKAATLKSIEIFVKYDFGLLEKVQGNPIYESFIKKMLITDIISYADNLISRVDIRAGSPQEEKGLDTLTEEAGYAGGVILKSFLESFNFHSELSKYRDVRNKCCGHIDVSVAVADLENTLNSVDLNELKQFFQILQGTFNECCSKDFLLRMFLIQPGEKINAVSVNGLQDLVSFAGRPYQTTVQIQEDLNNESEYINKFKLYCIDKNEDARSYFYNCFDGSELVETVTMEFGDSSYSRYQQVQIRKAHLFFKSMLLDRNISVEEKESILNLFSSCSGGYPNSLLRIVIDTYSVNADNKSLAGAFLFSIGELCHDENPEAIELLNNNLIDKSFVEVYNAILALFKIDVFSRRNHAGRIVTENTTKVITTTLKFKPHIQCVLAMGLLSYLYFNSKFSHIEKKVKACYVAPLETIVRNFVEKDVSKALKTKADLRDIRSIKACIGLKNYSTFCGLLGDFYERKKNNFKAKFFREALYHGWIRFAQKNDFELQNFAVVCYKFVDYDQAVKIVEGIVDRNPSKIEYRQTLLKFYLSDLKYTQRFETEKKFLLQNFNLNPKLQSAIEKMEY